MLAQAGVTAFFICPGGLSRRRMTQAVNSGKKSRRLFISAERSQADKATVATRSFAKAEFPRSSHLDGAAGIVSRD